jgi:Protein of unknown function, DUF481
MNNRLVLLSFFLAFTVPLFAREKTDVIVMKNNDRMTCQIKALDSGVLSVSFDYIDGTTSVQWSKVAHLESNQLFIVKTQDGTIYTGTLKTPETPAGQPVKIQVVENPEKEVVLDRSKVVGLTETSEKFWQRFNGQISWGSIYSKHNQAAQYNLGSQAEYLRERWSAGANFSSNFSFSTGMSTSTRNDLELNFTRLLRWDNYFYSGLNDFLQSSQQGIRLQTTLGGGIGRYLKNTNHASISVLGGLAWQNTDYQPSAIQVGTQNLATALIAAKVNLFKFSKTNLSVTATLFPAISEPGRVRFNANAAYYVKLVRNLKWNISFYGNWDNRPPAGFSGSDYGSSSGLSWTFGPK